nr:unnamed protein product [Callosobruchus analis]
MSWSREQVQALIEQYRQNPCLYAVDQLRTRIGTLGRQLWRLFMQT